MSSLQQDRYRERERQIRTFIPHSPSHPDLSGHVPPSTDFNAEQLDEPKANATTDTTTGAYAADDSSKDLDNMPQYTSRDVGDPTQIKKNKQSMADLKLRRLTELNNRLREDLERERIPVSQASKR